VQEQHLALRLLSLASVATALAAVWQQLAELRGNRAAVAELVCQPQVEPLQRPALPGHLPWQAWDQTHSHQILEHLRQREVAQ
jgi:hypothetical protein